jgi:DNA-binding XRE family transcriptional regulator
VKLDIAAIKANDHAYVNGLKELCARVANTVANRASMPEYVNDLTSELLLIVLERLPEVYDGESDIDAFVWEAGRRLVMGQHRQVKREVSASDVDHETGDAMVDTIADEDAPAIDEWTQNVVTHEQALEAKRLLIEQMRAAAGSAKNHATPSTKRRRATTEHHKRNKKKRKPWIERSQLGYTQAMMARALGISTSHYRRLEEAGPPPDRLRPRLDALRQNASKLLPTDSGSVLVQKWAAQLGLDPGDVSGMATMLGVHRTTIFRWATGRSDPPPNTILVIEAKIAALLEVRQRWKESLR